MKPTKIHTARELHEYAAAYMCDADWYRAHAERTPDPLEAERDARVAAWLQGAALGYRFRAREMAYDACGGHR